MKPHRIFLLSTLLAVGSAVGLQAAGKTLADDARIQVAFLEPQNFTDFRDSDMGYSPRNGYAEDLRERLAWLSRYYVPVGHKLEVTFTDIDMAGDFEPWRGPAWSDVRIVKEIYAPRIVLSFRLTDAAGNIVKEGKRELKDSAFWMKVNPVAQQDTLRHEKALLDDWLRAEFPRIAKR